MELHAALCCAVPNAQWLEYIPQLDPITNSRLRIENGFAYRCWPRRRAAAWCSSISPAIR
jgi:hypothetical protein